jgi:hypothetical protein
MLKYDLVLGKIIVVRVDQYEALLPNQFNEKLVRRQRDKSTVKKIHQYQMHLGKILGAQYNTDIIRYRKNFSIELRF